MMPAPGWKPGQIINQDDGCPDMEANIGAFAMPGLTAGTTSPAFLGGSNLADLGQEQEPRPRLRAAQDPASRKDYQKQFADQGTIPALKSLLGDISGSEGATAQAKAAENSRFVPSSENWAAVEASSILPDMVVAISGGADVKAEAAKADAAIEAHPQRLSRTHGSGHRQHAGRARCPSRQPWKWKTRQVMEHVDGITPRRRRVRPLPYALLLPAIAALGLMLGYPIVRLVHPVAAGVRSEAAVRRRSRLGRPRQLPRRSCTTPSSGRCCAAPCCSAP